MSDEAIRVLYQSRVNDFAEALDLPVQRENESFTPPSNPDPADNTYLKCLLLPAPTIDAFLEGGHRAYRGVFQVSVVTAKNIGPGAAAAIAAKLRDRFPKALVLSDETGFEVQIMTPLTNGPGITGDIDYTLPTSFTYRADTT